MAKPPLHMHHLLVPINAFAVTDTATIARVTCACTHNCRSLSSSTFIGEMLNPARRQVFARFLAFNHRGLVGHACTISHTHAAAICFRRPLRSSFFSLPSLSKLPFGQVPQLVSFSDIRVVPYPSAVVVETVCDVNRYKVASFVMMTTSRSASPISRNFFPGLKTLVLYPCSRVRLPQQLRRAAAAAAAGLQLTSARDCVSYVWDSAPSQRGVCARSAAALPHSPDASPRYVSRVTVSHAPGGCTLVKATAGDRLLHPRRAQLICSLNPNTYGQLCVLASCE